MWLKLLMLAIGGSIGTVARYLFFIWIDRLHHSDFPWATLGVNLLGSFLIGLCYGYFDKVFVSTALRAFLFIGIFGSFTTFSTFAFDNFALIQSGNMRLMILYVLSSNVLGIGLCLMGYSLSRLL